MGEYPEEVFYPKCTKDSSIESKLKVKIASSKQGNLEVTAFFTQLMGLWNELENYGKQPKCTCGAAETYAEMNKEDKVHQFLMGLDDDAYSNIQSQILALDPLPSLDKIYSMVQQEGNHKKVMQGREHKLENAFAFAVSHFMKAG